jgi:gas vesicle protein
MSRFTSLILGALVGGIIGTALGLLLAPTSGPALREQIQENTNRLADEVRKASLDKRAELEQQYSTLTHQQIILPPRPTAKS